MPKASPISYNIIGITIEQFAIVGEPDTSEDYEMTVSVSTKSAPDEYRFGVFANYKFEHQGKPLVVLEIACHFLIEEASFKRLKKKGDDYMLPRQVGFRILTLANDTARGVLVAKLEHTPFSYLFLPEQDPAELETREVWF